MRKINYFFVNRGYNWDYLSFRLCIGVWIGILLLVMVATDASAFVCYITRFTEENFATLIALIFVKKAFEKVRRRHVREKLVSAHSFLASQI